MGLKSFLNIQWLLLALCASCGAPNIDFSGAGASTPRNDPLPRGVLISQCQFFGVNGYDLSGGGSIYYQSDRGHILRLTGFKAPAQSNLLVQVYGTPGGLLSSFFLTSSLGSQNYSFSPPSGSLIQTINIYSNATNLVLGQCQF